MQVRIQADSRGPPQSLELFLGIAPSSLAHCPTNPNPVGFSELSLSLCSVIYFFLSSLCFSSPCTAVWNKRFQEKDELTYVLLFSQGASLLLTIACGLKAAFYTLSTFLLLCTGQVKSSSGYFNIVANRSCI